MASSHPDPVLRLVSARADLAEPLAAVARELDVRFRTSLRLDPESEGRDVVCLDERLPGAFDSFVRWRARGAAPPVLWLTEEPRGEGAEAALRAGAEDVLALPVWAPEARARLAPRLGRSAARADEGQPAAPEAVAPAKAEWEETFDAIHPRQSEKLLALGQIAAGVAKEINNPLTAVSSYAQLLALEATEPKAVESARRIREGVDRIHRLVSNLMSFARPFEETFFPVDLNEVVSETLAFNRFDLLQGDTQLAEELEPRLPKILGAKDELRYLLVNLLTNARDALGGRGNIRLRTRRRDGEVLLEVEDDGVGMAPAEMEKIFEPFYTTKPIGKGTGLGLFIAAGIARKHGGVLTAASEPGRGSRFVLAVPAFGA
ncbi:MAG: hypothetical protein HY900_25105 [Deltaproteobacteria bacterium]|nr:hypothetical protein [Deltaproteobacteria bacterium]